MKLPKIIQGGMGVAISDWRLANAVSKLGSLGVVSGTGINHVMTSRLMDGDSEGHVRRALKAFPFQESVKRIIDKYYLPNARKEGQAYKRPAMWSMKPSKRLNEITVISNFVEVFLAKEGHNNPVGINLLEKVQLPNLASLYGAMLAGVNYVIMGAGIPTQIPGVLDSLAKHEKVSYRLDVHGGDEEEILFNPQEVFTEVKEKIGQLSRPFFMPIVSSVVLAKSLIKRATGKIDGFVIEAPIAGGHNAPPRGKLKLNEKNEPIYGDRDKVDFSKIKELGLPFWLAGGYDSPQKLEEAIHEGAEGIQVGTAFAICEESGMEDSLKKRIIEKVFNEDISIRTDAKVSSTGFPFKVLELEGTLSDPVLLKKRNRICDVGLLRKIVKQEDGKIIYRCSAEPEKQFLAKGGNKDKIEGTSCLCNNLLATAGFPQLRKDGYIEEPIVTAGNGLEGILKFFKSGERSLTAKDVLDYLTGAK